MYIFLSIDLGNIIFRIHPFVEYHSYLCLFSSMTFLNIEKLMYDLQKEFGVVAVSLIFSIKDRKSFIPANQKGNPNLS